MNNIKQKIIGMLTAVVMLMPMALPVRVHADTESAYAKFDAIKADCMNMTAAQTNLKPTIKEEKGKKGWRLNPNVNSSSYIRCNMDDSFMYALSGEFTPIVEVTYFDGGYGGFCLYYDSTDGNKGEFVQLENSGEWKTKKFCLYDAYFGNRLYKDDFWIAINQKDVMGISSDYVIVSDVKVTKTQKAAPFKITAATGKPGNIFFEGDTVQFDVSYDNITAKDYVFYAEYAVRDYNNNIVKSYKVKKQTDSLSVDKVKFSGLPYGVYKLDIKLTGNSIEQEYTTEFSYARKADKTNNHFGINIHYDDEAYTTEDAKNLSDLIKNSGFGFVRSSLRWNQIEKEKGVYKIPETVKYANRYLNEIGLEMLAILYTENRLYTSEPFYNLNAEQMAAFKNYCRYVAKDLKGYTNYFCMLNEINHNASGYLENQQEYVDISKAGYEGIKEGNPNAFINCGSLAGWSRDYANKTYQLGILNYCDSYSMHIYDHVNGPETYYMYTAETDHKANLRKYDTEGTKQAWITESGWPTRAADDTSKEDISREIAKAHDSASELRQAQWYTRSMAINGDKSRIDKFFYYSMSDNGIDKFDIQSNFGILRAKNYPVPFAAKPAYIAVCAYNDIIGDAEFVGDMITDGTGYANKYRKADGSEVICLWASEYHGQTGGTYNYTTNAPYIVVYDIYGNAEYIENTTGTYGVKFTQEPVYVTFANTKPDAEPDEPEPTEPPYEGNGQINAEQDGEVLKALWFLNPEEKIKVTFETDEPAGTPMTVICAAYKNGVLIGIETKKIITESELAKVYFNSDKAMDADCMKLMVFDSIEGLIPLKDVRRIDCFDKDSSVMATVENGMCKISGRLKNQAENEKLMITVFSQDTRKSVLTEESVTPYILYQDQIKSGKDGVYEFVFNIPPSYEKASAMVIISTKDNTIQSVVPTLQ